MRNAPLGSFFMRAARLYCLFALLIFAFLNAFRMGDSASPAGVRGRTPAPITGVAATAYLRGHLHARWRIAGYHRQHECCQTGRRLVQKRL